MRSLEALRRSFRPERISTVFVAEAVPRGNTFFYERSGKLYHAMQRVFNARDLLATFEDSGFYLDHLVLEPIAHLPAAERKAMLLAAVPTFADRLRAYRPEAVVVVMRSILPFVRSAMRHSGLLHEPFCAAFPANGNQARFHKEMTEILPQLATQ